MAILSIERDDGKCVMKNGVPLDNRHIVPYSPYLSKKYNAHINVEICSTINSCKYLYKCHVLAYFNSQ